MPEGYVAEYLRISDDDNDLDEKKLESDSIANQRGVVEDYISKDVELQKYPVKEFCDDGYSGVTFNRPAFQKLLKEIREKKIYCIIVKDFSRFGRNYIEVGDYLEQFFPFMGVRVISLSDCYDSDKCTGGIEVAFKTLIHDLYSKDLSRKIKPVKRLYQEKGQFNGGNIPYGYVADPSNRNDILIDEEAAEIVRRIFHFAAEGRSTGTIAKRLNQDGIPTPGAYQKKKGIIQYELKNQKGNLWTTAQVRELLQNESYIGTYVCHKSETRHVREVERLTPDAYIRHENAHEPIISKEIFEMAGKAIKPRAKRGRYEKKTEQTLLKGKVKCGCCGYSMNFVDRTKIHYYGCRMGVSCGSGARIEEEALNAVVLKSIQKLVAIRPDENRKEGNLELKINSELLKLKEEKRMIAMKQERFKSDKLICYKQYKEGGSLEEYKEKKGILDQKLKNHGTRMEAIEGQIASMRNKSTGTRWSFTRELAQELIEKIEVYEDSRVEIFWKGSMKF